MATEAAAVPPPPSLPIPPPTYSATATSSSGGYGYARGANNGLPGYQSQQPPYYPPPHSQQYPQEHQQLYPPQHYPPHQHYQQHHYPPTRPQLHEQQPQSNVQQSQQPQQQLPPPHRPSAAPDFIGGGGGGVNGGTPEERRARRLARNRESARQSRQRKKQYLEVLEEKVAQLVEEVEGRRRAHVLGAEPALQELRHEHMRSLESVAHRLGQVGRCVERERDVDAERKKGNGGCLCLQFRRYTEVIGWFCRPFTQMAPSSTILSFLVHCLARTHLANYVRPLCRCRISIELGNWTVTCFSSTSSSSSRHHRKVP